MLLRLLRSFFDLPGIMKERAKGKRNSPEQIESSQSEETNEQKQIHSSNRRQHPQGVDETSYAHHWYILCADGLWLH